MVDVIMSGQRLEAIGAHARLLVIQSQDVRFGVGTYCSGFAGTAASLSCPHLLGVVALPSVASTLSNHQEQDPEATF
jgi:hypothetical protein